ncbi:MAG: ankyrin repeat domain-containing protein, partial [Candidatus Berkiella sp.]
PGLMSLFLKQEKQKINIDALTFKDDAVDNQFSSVYMASLNGNDICLRLLLAHGADPNLPSGVLKWSPLHAACINGHADCVYDLLEAGANPDALDAQGGTALHNLASAPNITPEDFQKIEQWFVQASAKFNVKLKGYMPDQLAANAGHQLAIVFSESLKFHKVPSLKAMCQTVLASQGTVLQGDFAPRFHRK